MSTLNEGYIQLRDNAHDRELREKKTCDDNAYGEATTKNSKIKDTLVISLWLFSTSKTKIKIFKSNIIGTAKTG